MPKTIKAKPRKLSPIKKGTRIVKAMPTKTKKIKIKLWKDKQLTYK